MGDTSKTEKACDTSTRLDQAKITTLKNNGYKVVGCYLTIVPNSLDKKYDSKRSRINFIKQSFHFPYISRIWWWKFSI